METRIFPPIPKRKSGRPPKDAAKRKEQLRLEYEADLQFARAIEELHEETGLRFGPRGWAYYIEGLGQITKGQFAELESCIVRLRKAGILNPDVVPDDSSREVLGIEPIDYDTPETFAANWLSFVSEQMATYSPISIWDGLDTYIEVAVEKKDLLQIFEPICTPLGIPLSNLKGWSDLNTRRHMLTRMRDHHREGRQPVLLYIGDHDPKGLLISDALKSNLLDCQNVQGVDWNAEPITVLRIGLTRHQIDSLNLVWIDNLETSGTDGSGKARDLSDSRHPDFHKDYVQTYLAEHGARKVEANALVANVEAAQQILLDAIGEFIPAGWQGQHIERLEPERQQARQAFNDLIANQGGE